MMKLMSSDYEVDKLKLNNDEVYKLKNPDKKYKRDIQKKKLIDTPYENNINILILFLKNMSHLKIYTS